MQIFSKELLFASDDLHGVKEFTQEGTHTFKLSRRTRAKITMVGSGQDSYKMVYTAYTTTTTYISGQGGGYFVGQAYLPAGAYSLTINKSIETKVNNDGSTYASDNSVVLSNSLGELIRVNSAIIKNSNFEYIYGTIEHEEQGNGTPYSGETAGGASLYNGYGKGADARKHNNTLGYFKIEW